MANLLLSTYPFFCLIYAIYKNAKMLYYLIKIYTSIQEYKFPITKLQNFTLKNAYLLLIPHNDHIYN